MPRSSGDAATSLSFLNGGGVSGALARSVDWSSTPLGPPQAWPESLKSTVAMLLHSRHPMFLWWGEELIQFYNDAYLPSFGRGKHPAAMGQRGADCWQEIWPIIWPQIEDVMQRALPSWNVDHLVPIFRNGRIEEVYWTYGYSPVFDGNRVAGTLVVCTETTQRVLAERRLRSLQTLDEHMSVANDRAGIFGAIAEVLSAYPNDVPFALIYDGAASGRVELASSVGLHGDQRDSIVRALRGSIEQNIHAANVAASAGPIIEIEGITVGPWPEPVTQVYTVSLLEPPGEQRCGFVAFGLSPRLALDASYRDYLDHVAERISQRLARYRAESDRERLLREIKAEQERLTNLFAQAPAFMCYLEGPDHVFKLANERYYELVGRRDILGKPVREALPEVEAQGFTELLDSVFLTGESRFGRDSIVHLTRRASQPPEERIVDYVYQASRDSDGTISGILVHGVDQTERFRAAQAMKEADRRKDEFLAMLAHELRNPLAPIANYARAMDQLSAEPQAVKRAAQVMNRQVDQMIRLVDDLLDVSRIGSGKIELRRGDTALPAVVQQAVEAARPFYETRGVQLVVEGANLPLRVDGDAARLAQIVGNLLHNAAKFSERGGRVHFRLEREANHAVMRVRDEGVGIAEGELSRIFVMFTQVDTSLERTNAGLGIGLALVKSLVELHGGTVEAHSAGLGCGSEFVLRLPLQAQTVVADEQSHLDGEPAASDRARILIVDDNRDGCDSMAILLRMEGHDVRTAYDGAAGVDEVERFQPNVVLMDIGMPKLNGYEACRRIRAQPRGERVVLIALTGWGQVEDMRRTEEAGFNAHLVKPVDPDALAKVLAAALAGEPSAPSIKNLSEPGSG